MAANDLYERYGFQAQPQAVRQAQERAREVVARLKRHVRVQDYFRWRPALEIVGEIRLKEPTTSWSWGEGDPWGLSQEQQEELLAELGNLWDLHLWTPEEARLLLLLTTTSSAEALGIVSAWMEWSASFRDSADSADPLLSETVREMGDAQGAVDDELFEALLTEAFLERKPMSLSLRVLPKAVAYAFVKSHHSKLGAGAKIPPGVMFAIGAFQLQPDMVTDRLVAVALAGSPTGRWASDVTSGGRPIPCGTQGILELFRVASIGDLQVRTSSGELRPVSASSMLTSHIMRLLPLSGRGESEGCLFVTYSLASERGTTYLSLASAGLRPVARIKGKVKATGARRGGEGTALPHVSKVRWEYGPAALPPDWSVLDLPWSDIRGPWAEFEAYARRAARKR
jgi:hypothetical protein